MSYIANGRSYGMFEKQALSPLDDVTDTYTLNYRPGQSGAILVVLNGVVQEPGNSYNLIEGGRKIKFASPPAASPGTTLYVLYMGRELSIPTVAGNFPYHLQAVALNNEAVYTLAPDLPITPVEAALLVFADGLLQSPGHHYDLVGKDVIFRTPPADGTRLEFYLTGIERTETLTVDDGTITPQKLNLGYLPLPAPGVHTFNGMAHSAIAPSDFVVCKYMKIGKAIRIRLMFTVTFGGTPDSILRITLPPGFENDGTGLLTGSVTLSTPSVEETGIIRWGALNSFDIKRQGGVDYVLGTPWTVEVAFEFETI
jgi:hypothetical protein